MGPRVQVRTSRSSRHRHRLARPSAPLVFTQNSDCSPPPCFSRTATCGNMLAALALSAISTPLLPYTTVFTRSRSLPPPSPGSPLMFPLSILSASNGLVLRARVPMDPLTLQVWEPKEGEGCVIAGVPGEGVGVEVEMPIQVIPGVEGGLVTGRPVDSIDLNGITVSFPPSPPCFNRTNVTYRTYVSSDPNLDPLLRSPQYIPLNLFPLSPTQPPHTPHLIPNFPPFPQFDTRKDSTIRSNQVLSPSLPRVSQNRSPIPSFFLHFFYWRRSEKRRFRLVGSSDQFT